MSSRFKDIRFQMLSSNEKAQMLRVCLWMLAVVLAALQAWTFRHEVGGDGVSYLDMGDAYFRGDWSMAVNSLWSPLYSWFLTLGLHLVKPSSYWEYTTVHGVNFVLFLLALVCFEIFLRQFIQYYRNVVGEGCQAISTNVWRIIGYTIFMWCSLDLIGLAWVNPDVCIAGIMFLSFAILLRIRQGSSTYAVFLLLGFILGIGYLAKTIVLPLAIVFVGAAVFSVNNLRQTVPKGLVAVVVLLLVALPFIIALSMTKGHLTIGDSGKLNYAWHVNGIPDRHWQGEPESSGIAHHPTRKLFDTPAVYEFSSPSRATYPMWYDPSYWYEGVSPRFNWKQQTIVVVENLVIIITALFGLSGSMVLGLFVLLFTTGPSALKQMSQYLFMLIPATVAIILYAVIHVETRYVAPFFTVLFLVGFASVRIPACENSQRLITALAVAMFLMLFNPFNASSRRYYSSAISILRAQDDSSNKHWKVAEALKHLGIGPGDKVASTSYANYNNVTWARLARVQIMAEVYYRPGLRGERKESELKNNFWTIDSQVQQQIICLFNQAGAKAIVADDAPGWATNAGWISLADTGYRAYLPSTSQDCAQASAQSEIHSNNSGP